METISQIVARVKSVIADEDRRWLVIYFAVLMMEILVSGIDLAVFGSDRKVAVANHPWLTPLDRCLFFLFPALVIVAIVCWVVCLGKSIRVALAGCREEWVRILILTALCSPFGPARQWLRRIPAAASLAETLDSDLSFWSHLVPFAVLFWFGVVGFMRLREEARREIEAYKARRALGPLESERISSEEPRPIDSAPLGR